MDADQARPLADVDLRSPDPSICPFLRAQGEDALEGPIEAPDDRNRCIAGDQPDPQTPDWQRTACLSASHVRCPRYLLGAAGAPISLVVDDPRDGRPSPGGPIGPERRTRVLTPAVVASLVLLVASAAAAVSFVTATGGLQLRGGPPSQVTAAGPTPQPSPGAPTPTPDLTPGPTPTVAPEATPAPTPTLAPTVTPAPTSDRYVLLSPCPSKPSCYLYTVQLGNNLRSIANYFGVPYETVLELNPEITDPSTIHPGDVIVLPPPTR